MIGFWYNVSIAYSSLIDIAAPYTNDMFTISHRTAATRELHIYMYDDSNEIDCFFPTLWPYETGFEHIAFYFDRNDSISLFINGEFSAIYDTNNDCGATGDLSDLMDNFDFTSGGEEYFRLGSTSGVKLIDDFIVLDGLTEYPTFITESPNTAPVLSSGQFNKTSYKTYDDLKYSVLANDAENDTMSVSFVWSDDSGVIRSINYTDISDNEIVSDDLSNSLTETGDNISVSVIANDGTDDSNEVTGSKTISDLAECENGIDDDSDNETDYPDDPGCSSSLDSSEYGSNECDDGIDNDSDSLIDYPDDNGCTGLTDNTESTAYQPTYETDDFSKVIFDFIISGILAILALTSLIVVVWLSKSAFKLK